MLVIQWPSFYVMFSWMSTFFFPLTKLGVNISYVFWWKPMVFTSVIFFPQGSRLGDVRCVKKSFESYPVLFSPKAWQNSQNRQFFGWHCFFMVSFLAWCDFFNYPKLDAFFFGNLWGRLQRVTGNGHVCCLGFLTLDLLGDLGFFFGAASVEKGIHGGKPWALEPKTRKGGTPEFTCFCGVSRDSSIDGKRKIDHIDRAPIDAPQKVFSVVEVLGLLK